MNRLPGRLPVVLGIALAALALLLPSPDSTTASSLATWQGALATDQHRLSLLQEQLADIADKVEAVRLERDSTLAGLEVRLVSIYKANGVAGLDRVLSENGSVQRANDMADVVNTVSRHDARELRRYHRLTQRIPALQRQAAELRHEIGDVKREIKADRKAIKREYHRRAQAQLRAIRMARTADAPLTPRAVAPETVSASLAGTTAARSSGYSESGVASVYDNSFAGEETANGESYDPGALTAAHQTLPLGTWVSVEGPGGSVLVRINDRGPFIGGRIIDLSPASAAAVGIVGLGDVKITVQN